MQLSYEAFLSHRYKSPAINLYFFDLLSRSAQVQFEVDDGVGATNVTRLERLVGRSDAFVGIYGLPPETGESAGREELLRDSRYFRLELDLALRSRKPVLVFYDKRLEQVLPLTNGMWHAWFNHRELTGPRESPRRPVYDGLIQDFQREVSHSQAAAALRKHGSEAHVGILMPRRPAPYSASLTRALERILDDFGVGRVSNMSWPPKLDRRTFEQLGELSWMIAEVSPETMSTGLPGYLHGRMLPLLRTCAGARPRDIGESPHLRSLFAGVEVGYAKDIVFWTDEATLVEGVGSRLPSILFRYPTQTRFNTREEAESYFHRAALRKETVFLSYARADVAIASEISAVLKSRFKQVFDYRDGQSIRPGQPWLEEIFGQLATSAVGVPLVSASYLASGNCVHEAQEMVARRDAGQLRLVPVKLYVDDITDKDRPVWMSNIQYHHWYTKRDARALVSAIEAQLGPA